MESFLTDPHFQDNLLKLLVHDREFLKQGSHLLEPKDFKGVGKNGAGRERQIVADVALKFWGDYKQPLGKMLRVELLEHARKKALFPADRKTLLEYGATLLNGRRPVAPDSTLEKVRQYKFDLEVTDTLLRMQESLEGGQLNPENFMEMARECIHLVGKEHGRPTDIYDLTELQKRMRRRWLQAQEERYPVLMIDPIDRAARVVARRHLGLVLAPYKRGKTLFFIWLALAYTMQSLNVLHFTLEDPQDDIEDRFDAAITALPISRLADAPKLVRVKFERFKRRLNARLKVVDGTDRSMTIQAMEHVIEQERNQGFTADVVLIDYDDEIRPAMKRTERRMEFADIYRDLRAMLARHDLIGWTASQTTRKSEDMKIISGKEIAEDISKIRKCSFAMSLGKGDWGENSTFLWVAAHRNGPQHFGANIMMDKGRALFYDREATQLKERTAGIEEQMDGEVVAA